MEKRLYRNEHDKVIAGVCSGLADYMKTDVTVIRLMLVLLIIFGFGTGLLVYVVMWVVIPVNNDPNARMKKFNEYFQQDPSTFNSANAFNNAGNTDTNKWNTTNTPLGGIPAYDPEQFRKKDNTGRTIGGLALLIIGVYFLAREFHILPFWVNFGKLWPVALVVVGLSFILKARKNTEWEQFKAEGTQPKEPIVTPPPAEPAKGDSETIQNP